MLKVEAAEREVSDGVYTPCRGSWLPLRKTRARHAFTHVWELMLAPGPLRDIVSPDGDSSFLIDGRMQLLQHPVSCMRQASYSNACTSVGSPYMRSKNR